MAAFLVLRNVERLRVQLRKPTASNAGAEAADGNKAVVFIHRCNPHFHQNFPTYPKYIQRQVDQGTRR